VPKHIKYFSTPILSGVIYIGAPKSSIKI